MKKILSILASISLTATTVSSVMSCSSAPDDNPDNKLIDIEVSSEDVELTVDDSTTIEIKNYQKLKNFNFVNEDDQIIKVKHDYNFLSFQALKEGVTKIRLQADNSNEKIINVVIDAPELKIIDVEQDIDLVIGEQKSVSIKNASELKNVAFENQDQNLVAVELAKDFSTISFQALEPGIATIIVSADNAYEKEIFVDVQPLKEIKLSNDRLNLYLDSDEKDAIITINNFADLENIDVYNETAPEVVAIDWNKNSPQIKITALAEGYNQLVVKARGANQKNFYVEVHKLQEIKVDSKQITIDKTKTDVVKITNFSELRKANLQATSENDEIAVVDLNPQTGELKITGISAGKININLTADHALPQTIDVLVNEFFEIIVDRDEVVAEVNSSGDKITIENYYDLPELTITSDDPTIATAHLAIDEVEKIAFLKIDVFDKVDSTKIHLTGDHVEEKIIDVTTTRAIISLNKISSWVQNLKTKTVKINNFESLRNVQTYVEDWNYLTADYDSETGVITLTSIKDVVITAKKTRIRIEADNGKTKIFDVIICPTFNSNAISLKKDELQAVMMELEVDGYLNFHVQVGTSLSKLPTLLYNELRNDIMWNLSLGLYSIRVREWSSLPTLAELNKVGTWHSEMGSTIKFGDIIGGSEPIVKCNWKIQIED